MEDSKQDDDKTSVKTTSINWPARIFFSLFSASGIGLILGMLMSMDVQGVDGESGYAALVYIPTMIFFTFLALIFITNKRAHIVLAIISAIIWIVGMINGI